MIDSCRGLGWVNHGSRVMWVTASRGHKMSLSVLTTVDDNTPVLGWAGKPTWDTRIAATTVSLLVSPTIYSLAAETFTCSDF